ncbi:glycosyltransferase [Longimicrobium sp.]|uniref:glycosyltransferase n=1 Tax=Longimicrobium sp. TaxID=2029185 RepID=UPI002E2FBCE7|nr:glycosyltransferase [Longimicrobium sp.]HEX6036625.1 glycosyltransferase [Longimicrobium sp.]
MKLVIHNAARVWGGNEKWMLTLAAGLAARGHDVVLSCRRGGDVARRAAERGIRTAHARPGGGLDLPRALGFARWLRRERPDALLLTSWRGGPWGAWAARRAGVPRVIVRLGIVRTPERWDARLWFRRGVDGIIVNAPEIADAWARRAPWYPPSRIHVILNGIRTDGVDRHAASARLRAEIGADAGTLLVGGAGHVTHRKGFDVLLDAFARAGLADARVAVIGDGPELAALRARADALGIADRVHWLGRRDDAAALLAGLDLFVLPSRNEGMANVMLEAMAAGTPVIASDISGVRTAVAADGDAPPAGWIVPPEDASALAGALREAASLLRADPSTVRARTDEALRRVRARFGVERMVDEAEAVLFGSRA